MQWHCSKKSRQGKLQFTWIVDELCVMVIKGWWWQLLTLIWYSNLNLATLCTVFNFAFDNETSTFKSGMCLVQDGVVLISMWRKSSQSPQYYGETAFWTCHAYSMLYITAERAEHHNPALLLRGWHYFRSVIFPSFLLKDAPLFLRSVQSSVVHIQLRRWAFLQSYWRRDRREQRWLNFFPHNKRSWWLALQKVHWPQEVSELGVKATADVTSALPILLLSHQAGTTGAQERR